MIVNSHGAYDAAGLPILAGAQSATANVVFSLSNTELVNVDFNLSSLTLAPEIDPAFASGALTLLLSGLAVAAGRRSRVGTRHVRQETAQPTHEYASHL